MKRLVVFFFCLAAVAAPNAALAAYCGPTADTAVIQHLTILGYNAKSPHLKIDKTYVLGIDVAGKYAESQVGTGSGVAIYYFLRSSSGKWAPVTSPKWPASIMKQLNNTGYHCGNPYFKNRGASG